MQRPAAPFDLPRLLRVLTEHEVRCIVVGGVAAAAHGSTRLTNDLDICYERTQTNARSLARALHALRARLFDGERDLGSAFDYRTLQHGDMLTFSTDAGGLDCLAAPDGTEGFDDLAKSAVDVEFVRLHVLVASLDDMIRMKRASGEKPNRLDDRADLERLLFLKEEASEPASDSEV